MISLKNSIRFLPEIKNILKETKSEYLKEIYEMLDPLNDIYELIDEMIENEPSLTITERKYH